MLKYLALFILLMTGCQTQTHNTLSPSSVNRDLKALTTEIAQPVLAEAVFTPDKTTFTLSNGKTYTVTNGKLEAGPTLAATNTPFAASLIRGSDLQFGDSPQAIRVYPQNGRILVQYNCASHSFTTDIIGNPIK